jgi:hypothetical protein
MEQETPKTANQLYRESGSTLSFKEWIEREKAKGTEMINQEIADAIARLQAGEPQVQENPSATWYGLNKNVWIFGGLVIAGAIAYTIYKKRK